MSAEASKSSHVPRPDHVPRPWYFQWVLSREKQGTEMSRPTWDNDYRGAYWEGGGNAGGLGAG